MGDEKLSLSDWITFLSSESNTNISTALSFGAFLVAMFAVIASTTRNTWLGVGVLIIVGVVFAVYSWRLVPRIGRRAAEARRLLYNIMSGKQRDVSKIEQAWNEFLHSEK